jgi:hypothetical protein
MMAKILDGVEYVGSVAKDYIVDVAKFGGYLMEGLFFGTYSPIDSEQKKINERY